MAQLSNSRSATAPLACLLALVLASVACGDDRSTATGNFSAGQGTTGSESLGDLGDGDPGDGDPGDGDPGDGDPGDGDPGDGDPGDGDPGDGDPGDGDPGDGDPGPCMVEVGDDACSNCLESSCCAELDACINDAVCLCLKDCIDGGGKNNQCKGMCGIQGQDPLYQALDVCAGDLCPADC